jgi:rare lipoprotein A
MVQPNQLPETDLRTSSRPKGRRGVIEQTLHEIPDAVVSTARIIISAEEKLRGRLRSVLRVVVATLFLGISSLISLGANVTMAFAKKVSPETTRVKRVKSHLKGKFYHHSGRLCASSAMRNRVKSHHTLSTAKHGADHLYGIASWYGRQFNHRKTASGNRFNTHAMTAAHRTLPFGTKVCVTNLQNHKSCVVEITDRGPYAYNRVIDLSYAAAERLGMADAGTAEVELQILGTESAFQDIALGYSDGQVPSSSKEDAVFDRIPVFPNRVLDSTLSTPMLAEQNADR